MSEYSIFKRIKGTLDIKDVFNHYGVEVAKYGVLCPFHNDYKTPNIKFKDNRFKCFACGESGDLIDFVSKYFNITLLEAVKKLNTDFNLGLDMDKPLHIKEIKRYKEEHKLYDDFTEWTNETYYKLCDYYRSLTSDIRRYSPKRGKPIKEEFVKASGEIAYVEYLLNILMSKDIKDKLALFKDRDNIDILRGIM